MTRARLAIFTAALQAAAALGLAPLVAALLRLPDEAARAVSLSLWGAALLVALAAGAQLLPKLDRRRVLELPGRLAWTALVGSALALAGMTAWLTALATPGPLIVGVVLCAGALLALLPVPLYAFARANLFREAVQLGDEEVPPGRRLGLGAQLGYSIAAVAAAALVPAAVFGASRLDEASAADTAAAARITGAHLALAAEPLDVAAATTLVTRTPLGGGARALVRAPSGTLFPEEVAIELADRPYVEVPLAGALRGGAVRVSYAQRVKARGPLLAMTLLLLMVTIAAAGAVGRTVAREVDGVAAQIDRVAREEDPGRPGAPATLEVRRVMRSVNRLLDRIPRITVESFLAIERANDAQRLKSQFLANMSHDLRSPLNSILGFSELLLRGIEGPIAAGQQVALAAIQARGLHILRLLNEILDTAKIESGKMELHRQRAAPAELLRQAVQDARRGRPPQTADRLAVVLQPGMQPILCDPLRLTQIVTHLLNYGLDLAPDGKVTLRAREQAGDFVIELEHDGQLEPAEQLFDGFRRAGHAAGLNLALPLARRLVELHNGAVVIAQVRPARLRATLPALARRA